MLCWHVIDMVMQLLFVTDATRIQSWVLGTLFGHDNNGVRLVMKDCNKSRVLMHTDGTRIDGFDRSEYE